MQIFRGQADWKLKEKSAVAIGKFDGIHKGHQVLLSYILKQKERGMKSVAFTFDPPAGVFFGKTEEGELTLPCEKRALFDGLGVDILIEFPFNQKTASIPAEDFVKEILIGQMNAGYIVAGTDLSFGAGGRGNSALLNRMAKEFGFEVQIIDKIYYGNREISSSYVREEVVKGNMDTVSLLLGRNYMITGVVENGKQLGRKLGMPTLNLYPSKDKLLPPNGVYYSRVHHGRNSYKGISNVGLKPTVNDMPVIGVETYLYDFEGDLYGEEITVSLLAFKRTEKKFENVDALKRQMKKDVEEGRAFHGI